MLDEEETTAEAAQVALVAATPQKPKASEALEPKDALQDQHPENPFAIFGTVLNKKDDFFDEPSSPMKQVTKAEHDVSSPPAKKLLDQPRPDCAVAVFFPRRSCRR